MFSFTRCMTMYLINENMGESLCDPGLTKISQLQQPRHDPLNTDKLDFIELSTLENIKRMRRQAPDWEKIFAHI